MIMKVQVIGLVGKMEGEEVIGKGVFVNFYVIDQGIKRYLQLMDK